MRRSVIVALALVAQPTGGRAQVAAPLAASAGWKLIGLSAEEAATLLAILQDAQQRLSRGELQGFELLAEAIASTDQARVPARDVFLRVPFEKVWSIERVGSGRTVRQPYRLAYAPVGLGRPYWEIEVHVGASGQLERVLMLWKAPAPF